MSKWNLIIDVENCENCNNCFLACKDEHVDNDFLPHSVAQPKHGHRWINIMGKERGQCPMVDVAYLPIPCMHCDNAPCMKSAKDGAVYKRKDGIVIIDPIKAKGQKDIVNACPYDAIWWNEEKGVPQKCTFCSHLLDDGWKEPRCVQVCPTAALRVVRAEDAEMRRIVESEGLMVLHPERKTEPRVYYKNLFRYERCFIGGSVAIEKNGTSDCVEGATAILIKNAQKVGETVTDNYGDFKLDNLEENSGAYTIEIAYPDREKKTLEIDLKASAYTGTIWL